MKRVTLVMMFLMALSFRVSVFSQENRTKKEPASMEETSTPELYISENKLVLKNAPVGKKVEIVTIIGNKIREIRINNKDEEHILNLPRAIYIFKMDGMVKKAVIK